MVDVGATMGHYAFMAASAQVRVYTFDSKSTVRSPFITPNDVYSVPSHHIDLMVIHRWREETVRDIFARCAMVARIYILAHCDYDALIRLPYFDRYTCVNARAGVIKCKR
jgi:hypothetical protein